MEKETVVKYWQNSSASDLATARDLVKLKHYHWALFIYHLSIEKLLKSHLVKNSITPPNSHDLANLAHLAKLSVSNERKNQLEEISRFNINARYDSVKLEFYKKADQKYTNQWSVVCEEIIKWLNEMF